MLLLLMAMMIGWFEFQPRERVPHPAVCSLMSMAMFDGAHAELCAERMTMEFAAMEERLAAGASAARAAPGWLSNSPPATRQVLAAALEALQWQLLVWADIVLGQASETETTGFTEAAGVTAVQAAAVTSATAPSVYGPTEWTMVPEVEIPKEAPKHEEMEVDVGWKCQRKHHRNFKALWKCHRRESTRTWSCGTHWSAIYQKRWM